MVIVEWITGFLAGKWIVREAMADIGLSLVGQVKTGFSGKDELNGWHADASAQLDEAQGKDGSCDNTSATVLLAPLI